MRTTTTNKILALWTGRKTEWLTYKEIVDALKEHGISERTVARYLATLVRDMKLMKEERGYKKTFYKPYDVFWHRLSLSRDWFHIHEESLCRMGTEVINRMERSIVASKEADERIEKLISEEIDKMPKENLTEDEVYAEAIHNVLSKQRLTEAESKTLASLIESFLHEAFYDSLANPYGCAGTIEPYVLASTLEHEIRSLISSYMRVWSFMYMHPGASFEFQKYIQQKFPEITSTKKV